MGRGTNTAEVAAQPTRATSLTRHEFKNDSKIEAELEEYVADLGRFPTWGEIEKNNPNLNYLIRKRGRDYWALHFGFQPRKQGQQLPETIDRMTQWTSEAIEAELRKIHGQRQMMISTSNLPLGLVNAMYKRGGYKYWAGKLGLSRAKHQRWSKDEVESALRAYVGSRKTFPSHREFAVDNQQELFQALRRCGGIQHWADKLGLPRAPSGNHSGGRAASWNQSKAEGELQQFLVGREHFPSQSEFMILGRMSLWVFLQRHNGLAWWREWSGLPIRTSNPHKEQS